MFGCNAKEVDALLHEFGEHSVWLDSKEFLESKKNLILSSGVSSRIRAKLTRETTMALSAKELSSRRLLLRAIAVGVDAAYAELLSPFDQRPQMQPLCASRHRNCDVLWRTDVQ
jgi:hypothetical protein